MPCYSPEPSEAELTRSANVRGLLYGKQFEAVLCGVFNMFNNEEDLVFNLEFVDWDEVGISKDLVLSWWENHKEQDELRCKIEEDKRVAAERKLQALSKLSDEDREALGLT